MKINIKGFEISATFPSIALITFVVISNISTGYLMSFLAILFHETGHLIAMFLCGKFPVGLQISAFDIRILESDRCFQTFKKEIIITSFGVLFNFLLFLTFLPISKTFAYINLFVGIFNLLPVSSLDGGQLLFLFFNRKLTAGLSSKIIDIITIAISFPLFVLGILVLLNSKYNFSLLLISIYLILSLFIKKDKIL